LHILLRRLGGSCLFRLFVIHVIFQRGSVHRPGERAAGHARVRQRGGGPGTQRGQCGRAGHGDDTDDHRGDPAGLQREHAGCDLDPVAEDDDPEQDPDDRLTSRDGRQRVLQRPGVECALHQPDPDRPGAHKRVRGPRGEQGTNPAGLQDL